MTQGESGEPGQAGITSAQDPRLAAAGSLDIKALLTVALEQTPRDGADERILNRVATMTTVMELARLLVVAPVDWLIGDHVRHTDVDVDAEGPEGDEGEGHDDARA